MNAVPENILGLLPLLIVFLVVLFVGVIGVVIVLRLLGRKKETKSAPIDNLTIDLAAIGETGPPQQGPHLEFYGTPVRLVALVLAPCGRTHMPPEKSELRELVESIVPQLSTILDSHQPIYRSWQGQLSIPGFIQSFFNNMSLPGDHGKGTPWCSIAGRFEANSRQYVVGLICCAESSNSLGQVIAENPAQWMDTLRVKSS